MKKLFIVLCVLLTLVGFISCETQTETATLRVEMKNSRRTIQPGEDNLEIYGYKIVTVSPDGKESEPYYTYYSYLNLEGLNVGKWSIKVYGFNSDRYKKCGNIQKSTLDRSISHEKSMSNNFIFCATRYKSD